MSIVLLVLFSLFFLYLLDIFHVIPSFLALEHFWRSQTFAGAWAFVLSLAHFVEWVSLWMEYPPEDHFEDFPNIDTTGTRKTRDLGWDRFWGREFRGSGWCCPNKKGRKPNCGQPKTRKCHPPQRKCISHGLIQPPLPVWRIGFFLGLPASSHPQKVDAFAE